jgi:hypothetical protein
MSKAPILCCNQNLHLLGEERGGGEFDRGMSLKEQHHRAPSSDQRCSQEANPSEAFAVTHNENLLRCSVDINRLTDRAHHTDYRPWH